MILLLLATDTDTSSNGNVVMGGGGRVERGRWMEGRYVVPTPRLIP